LFGVRKPHELETGPDSALSATADVLYRPREPNADGFADGGLDLDDESVPNELASVIVRVDWEEFESDPEDRNVENSTLHPL